MGVIKLQQPLTQWDDPPSGHHQDVGHMPFLMGGSRDPDCILGVFVLNIFEAWIYNWIHSGKLT